ncbi:MAG: RidA family protein [Saprospiraceae bacterium]|jgi:2-iminobutanoate/2-iminopropanoate deaminase|nr:RidA family protein [Saprospiraceae bacterium]MBP6397622.1 Rid family detoxifying hydrolase [Saprospiraceae bacterium]MBP9193436.1 Rid family detoxifying hydrolase [Saprospiraceae bacterium]
MKTIINSANAPAPVGPYNQAVLAGNTLYISGQIAIEPSTGVIVTESIEAETEQVLKNLKAVLEEADMSFDNIVKCSVFVTDMDMFARINVIYSQYFEGIQAPARELVQVAALPKYVNIEISCIAVKS